MAASTVIEIRLDKREDFINLVKRVRTLVIFDSEQPAFQMVQQDLPQGSFVTMYTHLVDPSFIDDVKQELEGYVMDGQILMYPALSDI